MRLGWSLCLGFSGWPHRLRLFPSFRMFRHARTEHDCPEIIPASPAIELAHHFQFGRPSSQRERRAASEFQHDLVHSHTQTTSLGMSLQSLRRNLAGDSLARR